MNFLLINLMNLKKINLEDLEKHLKLIVIKIQEKGYAK